MEQEKYNEVIEKDWPDTKPQHIYLDKATKTYKVMTHDEWVAKYEEYRAKVLSTELPGV